MKLTTRLFVVITSVTLFAIVASLLLLSVNGQLSEAFTTSTVIDQTVGGMVELSILTSDYLISPSDRASSQWQSKLNTIIQSLASITVSDVEQQSLLQNTLQELGKTRVTFTQLVENKQQSGTASDVSQQLNDRLTGQISVDLQRLLVLTSKMKELTQERLDSAHQQSNLVSIGLLTFLFITIIAFYLTTNISILKPILLLTQVAETISQGELTVEFPESESQNEIGVLSRTFRNMTVQLRNTLDTLEQRVAARTRDLEIVAEVGTATSTILESKRLLQEVVDLTKDRFNLYHSHIYLLDEGGKNLELTAGAGEPGRIMVAEKRSIPLSREQSLVARAARERKGVTVNDVTQAPDFLPNALLPDTRSELAVPMMVGGNVIGVFDIQSEQVGRFTESDVNIQSTLAAQLATSIQNVRSFEQSKKQAELQSLVNMIGSRIQRTTSIEETLQTAIRELGTAIGASRVKAKIGHSNGDNGSDKRN